MANKNQYTRAEVIAAAHKGKGKTTIIAQLLGCEPQTVRNYARKYATVEAAIQNARRDFRGGLVDKAEVKLEQAIIEGKAWAIRLALTTVGKDRGYVEKQEISSDVNLSLKPSKALDAALSKIYADNSDEGTQ